MILAFLVRPALVLAGALALLYLLAALALYLAQYRLLYRVERASAAATRQRARSLGLTPWPADAEVPALFVAQSPPQPCRATVLVFHGNAGTALDRGDYVRDLQPLGYRVVLAEYPGYGACPGPLGEPSLVSTGRSMVAALTQAFPEPLYLLGESLGAGVASAIAADPKLPVAGVLLATPWDTLGNLAQNLYPLFPSRRLVRDRYDSVANLSVFRGPIGVILAEEDEIIPPRRTQRLVAALGGRARLWSLPGAGHNTWLLDRPPDWWRQVLDDLATRAAARP